MQQRVLVSVVMITYGHEKYIRQAIEGVLMQEGDFDLELVIANDCSPDNTDAVVQDVLSHHSNAHWIRYVRHEKNIGMMPNFIFALQQAKGKYVALCDGDDYWTDPFKLQKQVSFLEANLEYVLSFHEIKILKPNGELVEDFITKVPENYETQETLARLGNYIHTPSVVFRNVLKELPKEFSISPIGDYFLYMLLSEHGKLKYLEEEMAVYRYGVGIHSTHTQIKMAKANFKLFTLLLSYFNNPKINQILLGRQLNAFDNLEFLIRSEYAECFVSHHVFFKAIKSLKHPSKFWRKLKNKFR
jgi:glycosyltransferase involved in cell wall biosynthesis